MDSFWVQREKALWEVGRSVSREVLDRVEGTLQHSVPFGRGEGHGGARRVILIDTGVIASRVLDSLCTCVYKRIYIHARGMFASDATQHKSGDTLTSS